MEKRSGLGIVFAISSITVICLSLWFLLTAFLVGGFGGIFPLWGRFLLVFFLFWAFTQHRIKRIILWVLDKEISRGQLIGYLKNGIIFIALAVIMIPFWHNTIEKRYYKRIFTAFFPGTSTDNVKIINSTYFRWMDWNAGMIFSTDQDTFDKIIKDYKVISKDELAGSYFVDNVMTIPDIVFYNRKVKRSEKSYDNYFVAWSKSNKTVYFRGSNAFY